MNFLLLFLASNMTKIGTPAQDNRVKCQTLCRFPLLCFFTKQCMIWTGSWKTALCLTTTENLLDHEINIYYWVPKTLTYFAILGDSVYLWCLDHAVASNNSDYMLAQIIFIILPWFSGRHWKPQRNVCINIFSLSPKYSSHTSSKCVQNTT